MKGGVKNLKLAILNKSLNSDDSRQMINCQTFITTCYVRSKFFNTATRFRWSSSHLFILLVRFLQSS